jgi:polysaccharide deacetylase family protein (PEP-CTERM system associated)
MSSMSPHADSPAPGTDPSSPGRLEPLAVPCTPNVLSVDLEMWHETSCAAEVSFLLDLFREKSARATFFVLASTAQKEPALVRRIAAEGHEVASHGWDHEPLYGKAPRQFREEVRRATDTLADLAAGPVVGYRAAFFSIRRENYWTLDVLAEAGIRYDSSIFPISGPGYGAPDFPRGPVRVERAGGVILEFPLSIVRGLGRNLPVSGGGYFRLLPYSLIRRAVAAVNRDGLPFVAYCHPYEFREERLRWPPGPSLRGRIRAAALEQKFNLFRGGMRAKLSRLLEDFRFSSFSEVLRDELPR